MSPHAVDRLHAQVEQGQVEARRLHRLERLARVAGRGHVEAHGGQPHLEHLEDRRVVVDHEDLLLHLRLAPVWRSICLRRSRSVAKPFGLLAHARQIAVTLASSRRCASSSRTRTELLLEAARSPSRVVRTDATASRLARARGAFGVVGVAARGTRRRRRSPERYVARRRRAGRPSRASSPRGRANGHRWRTPASERDQHGDASRAS